MRTLADRAVYASGSLRERYPTRAASLVPRAALDAVGTFDEADHRIILAVEQSAAAAATWLGVPTVDPAELRRSPLPSVGAAELAARLVSDTRADVNRALAAALT